MSEAEEPVAAPAVRPGGSGAIAAAFEAFCRAFLRRYCALEVTAAAALPQGPMVLVSNHRSHLDSVALMVAAGLPFGRCALLAAEDYFFRTPWRLALLSRVLRLIPIRRRASARAFRDTLARSRAFLAAGGAALIAYPEGTRNTAPGLAPFQRGPLVLALSLGLPVVPAFVEGTERVLAKGRWLPRRGRVAVRFGAPIPPPAASAQSPLRNASRTLTHRVEMDIRALAAARPAPPATPAAGHR